jgi:hypothetical protein
MDDKEETGLMTEGGVTDVSETEGPLVTSVPPENQPIPASGHVQKGNRDHETGPADIGPATEQETGSGQHQAKP